MSMSVQKSQVHKMAKFQDGEEIGVVLHRKGIGWKGGVGECCVGMEVEFYNDWQRTHKIASPVIVKLVILETTLRASAGIGSVCEERVEAWRGVLLEKGYTESWLMMRDFRLKEQGGQSTSGEVNEGDKGSGVGLSPLSSSSSRVAVVLLMKEEEMPFDDEKLEAIGTKRVYRNKKGWKGVIVIRNKAQAGAQGYNKKEKALIMMRFLLPVARIESNQQPPGFMDPEFPGKMITRFRESLIIWTTSSSLELMSSIGELTFFLGLQVKQKEDGIFISQDKYVGEILKKFSFSSIRTANTPMETNKALIKDKDGEDVDVHLYRSMIGSLMYLTSSRPDIMYLKGRPKLGLCYPKDSPFILEAFSDSDYAGASLDRKSTTGGCQFLGSRYEHVATNLVSQLESGTSTTIFK
ncbi:hypothetical protein Tco_0078064 [Tanacetum coccineum]